MKQDSDILSQVSKETGFKVPEGYFADFAKKMAESLPEKEFKPEEKPTTWVRIRPWVYMAAMFAGIWCMMSIFKDMKNANSKNLGFNPEIANAMSDDNFVNDYMLLGNISDYDLLNEMYNEGIDASVFDADSIN